MERYILLISLYCSTVTYVQGMEMCYNIKMKYSMKLTRLGLCRSLEYHD